MKERIYYEINEQSARSAHEMMSFRDYKEGSLTAEYKGYVDEAYDLADKVAESRPEEADRVYGIADRYSKKMAANLNDRSRIGCMCPSVMICGPANFPVRKKEKQNAASDRNYQEFQEIQKMLNRIRSIGNGKGIIKSGDVDAVERLEKKLNGLKELQEKMKHLHEGGCPGSRMRMLEQPEAAESAAAAPVQPVSRLRNWPVQIKLAPVHAPYFAGAKLLIAADCTAYAYANFHQEFMRGKVTLIGCPKLDAVDYSEKLTEILRSNDIQSVTILRMEVPCCGGLEMAAKKALQTSGKFIPWQVVTISIDGKILD